MRINLEGGTCVVFYPHIGEYGGIERNIIALAEETQKKGKVFVLVCYYDQVGLSGDSLKVVQLSDHWNPFVKASRVRGWMRANSLSFVGLPLYFGCKAGSYAAMTGLRDFVLHYTDPPSLLTKVDTSNHSLLNRIRYRIGNAFRKRGVRLAHDVITMTKWNAVELENLYGRKFNVIYQGGRPPDSGINSNKRMQGNTLKLFSICRLAGTKNIEWILHAVSNIRDAVRQVGVEKLSATIAGTGPAKSQLESLRDELGLKETVEFPGFLTDEEVEKKFRDSDLFLVPGRQGYGLPVLEALYRHVPVVLNRESRVSEILNQNPFAKISENSCSGFSSSVLKHILQLRNFEYPSFEEIETLPTESKWAEAIGLRCKWW